MTSDLLLETLVESVRMMRTLQKLGVRTGDAAHETLRKRWEQEVDDQVELLSLPSTKSTCTPSIPGTS